MFDNGKFTENVIFLMQYFATLKERDFIFAK